MASVTRVNGLGVTVGTLYSPNCNLFLMTVKDSSGPTAIDLRDEDDAVNEALEQIIKELNPLAWFAVDADTGIVYLVMDKNVSDAAELQIRVRRIGKDAGATTTSIGPNDIDISGTTVVAAASFTVAA
jgi:hypothetical protein